MLLLPAVASGMPTLDVIHHCDALSLLRALPDACVDMILCDLPYGTTACSWDEIIPLKPMWTEFKRVAKATTPIVLTASQPFTSVLTCSNLSMFRCEWIWRKPQGTGYLNANRQPMKNHESVLVFSKSGNYYNPQMTEAPAYRATRGAVGGFVRDKSVGGYLTVNAGYRYPLTVIEFNGETGLHPTQKPVDLFEYLIRTYSRPNDIVLDPCVGSGTTAVAAKNTGRHFICGDLLREYVEKARLRLAQTDPYQRTITKSGAVQYSLFEGVMS